MVLIVISAQAPERAGTVIIDNAAYDFIDIFVDGGTIHYRKAGEKPREAALSDITSFQATYEMRLRTTTGDIITASRVEYADGAFRLTSPRIGDFVYPEDEVESIAFEGARALYADLERAYVVKAGVHIEDSPLSGEFHVSYIQSKGSENDQTLLVRLDTERVLRNWRHTVEAKQLLEFEDGETDKDVRQLGYKAERFVTADWSLYANGLLASDSDADIDFRAGAGAGVGRQFLDSDTHELLGELGYEYLHQRSGSVQEDDSFLGLGLSYKARVSKRRTFSEKARLVTNASRTRFQSETSIVFRSSSSVSIRLGFVVTTDDEPIPGTPRTTTSTEVAFGWTF